MLLAISPHNQSDSIPDTQLKMQSDWQTNNAKLIKNRVHGISLFINSKVTRMILKTHNYIKPIPVKFAKKSIKWTVKNYKKQAVKRAEENKNEQDKDKQVQLAHLKEFSKELSNLALV